MNLDIRCLSLESTQRLMNHHPGVGETKPFSRLATGQQQSTHACGLTDAHGADIGTHKLHGVVDCQTGAYRAAGRINTPVLAESILRKKQADLIGLARMLLVDPQWVHKARDGREAEIVQCKKCDACMSNVMQGKSVLCAAWPEGKMAAVKEKLGI